MYSKDLNVTARFLPDNANGLQAEASLHYRMARASHLKLCSEHLADFRSANSALYIAVHDFMSGGYREASHARFVCSPIVEHWGRSLMLDGAKEPKYSQRFPGLVLPELQAAATRFEANLKRSTQELGIDRTEHGIPVLQQFIAQVKQLDPARPDTVTRFAGTLTSMMSCVAEALTSYTAALKTLTVQGSSDVLRQNRRTSAQRFVQQLDDHIRRSPAQSIKDPSLAKPTMALAYVAAVNELNGDNHARKRVQDAYGPVLRGLKGRQAERAHASVEEYLKAKDGEQTAPDRAEAAALKGVLHLGPAKKKEQEKPSDTARFLEKLQLPADVVTRISRDATLEGLHHVYEEVRRLVGDNSATELLLRQRPDLLRDGLEHPKQEEYMGLLRDNAAVLRNAKAFTTANAKRMTSPEALKVLIEETRLKTAEREVRGEIQALGFSPDTVLAILRKGFHFEGVYFWGASSLKEEYVKPNAKRAATSMTDDDFARTFQMLKRAGAIIGGSGTVSLNIHLQALKHPVVRNAVSLVLNERRFSERRTL